MKKLLAIILLLFAFNIQGQSTTQTEYLYMTKGIKTQLESGLDLKRGYQLEGIKQIQQGDYIFNFSALIRTDKKDRYAGIVVLAKNTKTSQFHYKAIPVLYD